MNKSNGLVSPSQNMRFKELSVGLRTLFDGFVVLVKLLCEHPDFPTSWFKGQGRVFQPSFSKSRYVRDDFTGQRDGVRFRIQ
jgi:hypothetical protein